MSRRKKNIKKEILEDPKYMNIIVSKFINILMLHGKKTIAEKILYSTLEKISTQKKQVPIKIFQDVLNNVKPKVEVRSRRIGGATYQVPNEVKADRAQALAIRWLVEAARKRSGKSMQDKYIKNF